ncbi:hypothetical protein MIM_c20400 [Advenella mimigardefordensis DPN7]|uniref:Uncharacterized protein n=1 Tax=Advenella mimigardefordensis (strain DSM 17166 / LMG 22922 / DPN7) TaxID=1247726 RepID=W0PB76_ADVMD|nr:hypothetical protein MIM_c20400 [Advenella mimigardefordensis DPN7]
MNCGFDVYLVDQPQRGRSAWHPAHDNQLRNTSVQRVEKMFTAPEQFCLWPQAKHHSQWPGKGRKGDPVFDQFYASQVESVASDAITERNLQQSVAKLLDKIGPAILVTHSQSGSAGWAIADIRSLKVQAIIAIEPACPPIMEHEVFGGKMHLRWGVTHNAIEYSPPLKNATELKLIQEIESQGDDLSHCWLQVQPAHQLPNLANIPVLVLVSEASYHAAYDHCTVQWLRQAGVNVDFIRLKDLNIRGNGHMMMLEKNNIEIAGVVIKWLETHVI